MAKARKTNSKAPGTGINKITACGYKSISREQNIDIRPLTILAGANSSGKSSMIQPLLLMKQTLEASYDPGALLLSGPNVKFTSWDQLLSGSRSRTQSSSFRVGIGVENRGLLTTAFHKRERKALVVSQMTYRANGQAFTLSAGMKREEITATLRSARTVPGIVLLGEEHAELTVIQNRCFLDVEISHQLEGGGSVFTRPAYFSSLFEPHLRGVIHLPGLRGNPERNYPVAAVGETYQGTFQQYVAGVIATWQEDEPGKLSVLDHHLQCLGLTWKARAREIDDTQVELRVGRLARRARGAGEDMVSIADVGFGVSQVLPVVVALLVAEPGQMVYLEQPEIHLHPRAQSALADLLAEAAGRGVRVVAETHSGLILLRIQTLVAKGDLDPNLVALHWFERQADGSTEITSADLDQTGAFGDWPEDFGDVELELESQYLGAAAARSRSR